MTSLETLMHRGDTHNWSVSLWSPAVEDAEALRNQRIALGLGAQGQ